MRKILCFLLLLALLSSLLPAALADGSPADESLPSIRVFCGEDEVSLKSLRVDSTVKRSIQLRAEGSPEVVWKSSDTSLATVNKSGLVTLEGEDDGLVIISCFAGDNSGRSSYVKLRLVKDMHRISLEHYSGFTMRGGSIVTLTPRFYSPSGNQYTPSEAELKWEVIQGGDYAYFGKESSGTLCSNPVNEAKNVRIRVSSTAKPEAFSEMSLTVTPEIKSIRIYKGDVDISGQELSCPQTMSVNLSAVCNPAQFSHNIKWSSSLSSVTVNDGVVSAKASGRVIITAAAADGSGKSASVTINFE